MEKKDSPSHSGKGTLNQPYTCSSYRQEMILAGLRKRLAAEHLSAEEQKVIQEQIRKLEREMGLD
jgi:hypothetical protein